MRTLIVVALACAVVSLFFGLGMYGMSFVGQYNRAIYLILGPISVICNGLPPILLSVVLLQQKES
jgi:hypothetical protein